MELARRSFGHWLSDVFKPKKQKSGYKHAYTQTGVMPRISNFGDNIYASDTVQQCINAIAKEMKKLEPRHIKKKNELSTTIDDSINRILHNPNPMMTTADFIEKCIWLLYLKQNCYIYPVYELKEDVRTGRLYRDYKALYPINPREVTYYEQDNEDGVNEILAVSFDVADGRELFVNYNEIIHLKINYALNDFFGGDQFGRPNNEALLSTLKINHKLLESVGTGIETSYAVNGIVKYNTMLDDGTIQESLDKFNERLKNSESGILGLDFKTEYTPMPRDIKLVDKDTLDFVDKKILRNYGVPQSILDGTATAEIKRAWYDTTLEPLITMFNQAFTKTMFTSYQRSAGNRVEFFYNRLQTMTNAEILEQATLLRDVGAVTNNQLLAMFGLPPYEGGDRRLQSLNYTDVAIANKYQMTNAGGEPTNTQSSEEVSKEVENEDNI